MIPEKTPDRSMRKQQPGDKREGMSRQEEQVADMTYRKGFRSPV